MEFINLGINVKKIREGKNYTQNYLCGTELTRSSIAKIEAGQMMPTISKFHRILSRFDLTYEEFLYISNKYAFTGKDKIEKELFKISHSSDKEKISTLIKDCEHFLKSEDDYFIRDILNICKAILYFNNNSKDEAIYYAEFVWNRLSKFDNLYLREVRFLNCIFFIFPLDTAVSIVKKCLERLEYYREYSDFSRLNISFRINLIFLYISNNVFNEEILKFVDESIEMCKNGRQFDILGSLYCKKGIILNCLKRINESSIMIKKGLNILETLELIDQKKSNEADIEQYTNTNLVKI